VGAVRPAHCPCCGVPGSPAGSGRLGLVGHGLRERSAVGPWEAAASPETLTLRLRRYRCRECGAVVTAAPRGLLRGFLYGAVAIALALALWAHEELPGHQVRVRVSPWPSTGAERWHGWRSLRRWSSGAERIWGWLRLEPGQPRERAARAVLQLAASSIDAAGLLLARACSGALRT
jgi:hypothetical protein